MSSSRKRRCWCDLPDLVLISIAGRLLSLPDLAAFASVCRRWRSFLRSVPVSSHHPPLHFDPSHGFLTTPTLPTLSFRPRFRIASLDPELCLTASHGHIILLLSRKNQPSKIVLLADLLAGSVIGSPPLPAAVSPYYYAALTAPPSSPRSLLLLFSSPDSFLYWRPGQRRWSSGRLEPPVRVARVVSLNNVGRQSVLAVNDAADKMVEFAHDQALGEVRARVFDVGGIRRSGLVFDRTHFGPQLVECGRDLLLLLFVQREENGNVVRVDAYRLDSEKREWSTVRMRRDYAVFVDCGGKCAVGCYRPERWGMAGGTVQLAGTGCDTWVELPVCGGGGGDEDDVLPRYPGYDSPVSAKFMAAPRWPSPIWVYPSMFF